MLNGMMISPPPAAAPIRGGYLNSPAFTVDYFAGDGTADVSWGVNGAEWQDESCGCAEVFPICLPHTKSPSNLPTKGRVDPFGIESSYACTPPFKADDLYQMAYRTVDRSTEYRVAEEVALLIAALPPAATLPLVYPLIQGFAALIATAYPQGRGVIHASPYLITLLLTQGLIVADAQGNMTSVIGGHYVIANPWMLNTQLAFTGWGRILLSAIGRTSTFDNLTNEQREGAERHGLVAINTCGAVVVNVTVEY